MKLLTFLIIIIFIKIIDDIFTIIFALVSKKRFINKTENIVCTDKNDRTEKKAIKNIMLLYDFYYGWVRYKLRILGRIPCHSIRVFWLKYIYRMEIGKNVVIYGGFEIRSPWNIKIGEGSIIGDESKLDGRKGLEIGRNVNFSTGVWIWTEQHDINDPYFHNNDKSGKVTIDDYVWLGPRTIILPKTHIYEGAVVAAGAVVTKHCDKYSVYGGIPARKISDRNANLEYVFDGTHYPFY